MEMDLYCISSSLELWNNLEVQEHYLTVKTNTDGKQKNFVSPIREKSPNFMNKVFDIREWSYLLNISWTFLLQNQQHITR